MVVLNIFRDSKRDAAGLGGWVKNGNLAQLDY